MGARAQPTYIHRHVPSLFRFTSIGPHPLGKEPLEVRFGMQPLEGEGFKGLALRLRRCCG